MNFTSLLKVWFLLLTICSIQSRILVAEVTPLLVPLLLSAPALKQMSELNDQLEYELADYFQPMQQPGICRKKTAGWLNELMQMDYRLPFFDSHLQEQVVTAYPFTSVEISFGKKVRGHFGGDFSVTIPHYFFGIPVVQYIGVIGGIVCRGYVPYRSSNKPIQDAYIWLMPVDELVLFEYLPPGMSTGVVISISPEGKKIRLANFEGQQVTLSPKRWDSEQAYYEINEDDLKGFCLPEPPPRNRGGPDNDRSDNDKDEPDSTTMAF